jgi:alkylation response protein AidB-like acyl-CoA dehydrogenase
VSMASEAMEFTTQQAFAAARRDSPPSASAPLIYIRGRETLSRMTELAAEAIAYYGGVYQPQARLVEATAEPIGPEHALTPMPYYLARRGSLIAGGTPEIQRNNLARALLGLR